MMEVKANLSDSHSNSSGEESFQELFKQHYSLVVRKALVIVKEQALAEDIAQEVFVKLYHADRKAIENIQGWLTKVAVTTAYNHIRTEKRHHAREEKQKRFGKNAVGSVEDRYLELEDAQEVQKVLLKLSERDRDILIMKYSGYSYEEIAQSNGLEKISIGTLLARAKKRFRDFYAEERGDDQ
ncbi:sigma-70 family RNA polymerase sigma factor [Planomicrobium chinense]|uniref:RNA polymerase sigma factor SigX n=1 Tax=Planococcus TaxID=1372 RepID=UPI0009DF8EDF|nr:MULTISPECIES: RNA polymerase sigma factor SigX [Planococcus]MBX0314072.1 RNA polymerase sigma factor SigX [Planococcus glaciei]MBZ5203019.1 sigma-70 family RNA polymerase sigma factor [Planococcus chinensis]